MEKGKASLASLLIFYIQSFLETSTGLEVISREKNETLALPHEEGPKSL